MFIQASFVATSFAGIAATLGTGVDLVHAGSNPTANALLLVFFFAQRHIQFESPSSVSPYRFTRFSGANAITNNFKFCAKKYRAVFNRRQVLIPVLLGMHGRLQGDLED